MISISLGICRENVTSEVICHSNSKILIWKEGNTTITDSMKEYSSVTGPLPSELLKSVLVVNTSNFVSIRSAPRQEITISCCNEIPECESILLQYNGACLDAVNTTEDSTQIGRSTIVYSQYIIIIIM